MDAIGRHIVGNRPGRIEPRAQASQDDLPEGKDVGNYAGIGFFLALPGNVDIQIDYTYYGLPSHEYHIGEVSLGFRLDFGAPRASTGFFGSGSSKDK